MKEVFLICLGLIWIIFAVVQDLRKREVANWLNFSLIIFALSFRFFYSLFYESTFDFFYQGLFGLVIFFFIGNLFYYGRIFAGGDAKLMIALGVVLPFSQDLLVNLNTFLLFFLLFLFVGAIYGLIWSLFLGIRNSKKFSKDFSKRFKDNKKLIYFSILAGFVFVVLGFFQFFILYLGILIFILPYFYLGAKSVDEVCMVKKVLTKKLTEGDWLYKDVRVGKKRIKASWDGLSKEDIKILQKNKKEVLIRQGIPFTPTFLISFLILLAFLFLELGYSFW